MTDGAQHDEVDALARAIEGTLRRSSPAAADGGAVVSELRRLSGGASRETWSFVASSPGGPERHLILQRTQGGTSLGGPSMVGEDVLLAAAERCGVPVPPVVVDTVGCAPSLGEARITGRVEGEALGPRIVRSPELAPARPLLAAQCGRALAAIHAIDPALVADLPMVEPLGRLREGLDALGEARPVFELALRWLADHRPPPRPPAVVHGDFRVGNLLVDPQRGLAAVLDWELAHLGDPLEDLGWLCVRSWRFGGAGEVGGVGSIEDLLAAYAEAGGGAVDPEHVRWWIVVGTLTWGLICAVQARRHLDGHVRSVELATIGRRVCETEYDLLGLLDIPVPAAPPPPAGGAAGAVAGDGLEVGLGLTSGPHGRPTAAELVEAVRAHLADQVAPTLDGAAAFQLKVAANALAIVERELQATAATPLTGTAHPDEPALAAAIRAGTADTTDPELLAAIAQLVVDRLAVANPRWLVAPPA